MILSLMQQSIYFKLRKSRPCVITNLQFSVDLPEDDEIQISVLGNSSNWIAESGS